MRCPKCHYISFDSGDRCRNCGYEFSLAVEQSPVDVSIRRDELPPGRVQDVSLTALDTPLSGAARSGSGQSGDDPFAGRPISLADLPLFTDRVADDQAPLVTPPAVPRPPLSVRRANPNARPRPRPVPEELSLDLASEPDERDLSGPALMADEALETTDAAGIGRRFGAGLIDLAVLGSIEATVCYLTLRLSGLTPAEWRLLPLPPLIAFLLLLCGGYFILFTAAGGQTIGKMATRIRVVPAGASGDAGLRVSFNAAFIRTVASLGSVLALGTGFLPALFSTDRRAFHDRVADTRVVNA